MFDVIAVFVVLAFIIVSFYKEIVGPAFTFMIAIATLGVLNILSPKEMLSGFSNVTLYVIIILLLIGETIRKVSVIEAIFDRFFSKAKTYNSFLTRMIILVSTFSAFLNNTPLVAVMMPYIHSWSKKNNVSPSKLLIPLSYAAILGGCATLIGTSTNLIVNGMVIDQNMIPDLPPLRIFDFAYVGAPMILIGFLYLRFFANRLLPSKMDFFSHFTSQSREYIIEAQVRAGSKIIGKTVEEAGLRKLPGLFLVEIIRGDIKLTAVSPEVILHENDILYFAGDTETIAVLIDSHQGLTLSEIGMFSKKKHTEVFELVVSHNSTLINKTVKDTNFRGHFDSVIVAIHRNGERISGKIGSVRLKAGDAILILAGDDFTKRCYDTQDFYLMSKVREIRKVELYKVIVLLGGTALAIILSAIGVVSLFLALAILMIVILTLNIANPKDIHRSIDYNLGVIIALAIALGTAMIKTGAADLISNVFINAFIPLGTLGLLFGLYIITSLMAAYITNIAAVAILFPIALTLAINQGYPTTPFILVITFAAAANFMTPIGYQTNLMVYGSGGYSFKDFFKIGFPLTIIYMLVTVFILYYMYL